MIQVEYRQHIAQYYDVLSAIDLGRDAANLYQQRSWIERLRIRKWARPLLQAYQAAPGRIVAQALPLIVGDLDTLHAWLENPQGALANEPGRQLCARLRDGLAAVGGPIARDVALDSGVLETLDTLHAALWGSSPRPLLHVYDAPALRKAQFTNGRGLSLRGCQLVAVALDADPVQVGIQILHEATHAVTDPHPDVVGERDTAAGSAGYAVHDALERAVVERDQELIDALAPHWRDAYQAWRSRYRI